MNYENNLKITPADIFSQYKNGTEFKNGLGEKGLNEQSKVNERFYFGDHWYGLPAANSRPLVRRNMIKRVGEFKLSSISAAPITVNYSADGVPENDFLKEEKKEAKQGLMEGSMDFENTTSDLEISTIMSVLSDYFGTTAERVKFDYKKEKLLRNAYISGSGIAYTYWNPEIKTGLYADEGKTAPIKGDLDFQILNMENVVFGDPNDEELQNQPYIIISQRLNYQAVRREAIKNGITASDVEKILPDGKDQYQINAGTYGENELSESDRVTVLTKFWKEWDKKGNDWKVMCKKVTENAVVKTTFDIGIKLYPFAIFRWSDRYGTIYGESDITYQIPNQVAVNKALSAEVFSLMTHGMPKTIVNGDLIQDPISNDPGEIIKVYGTIEDMAGAIRYLSPPNFSGQLITAVNNLADNTLVDNGASEVALGNFRPDNATAIIQMRDASMQPLQLYQNKFYSCIEDIARIWAEFWINLYGDRSLKISDNTGSYYVPFHAERYKDLLISCKIDVGASPIYSVSAEIGTLDNLYSQQIINKIQYLERLPDGIIKDKSGLLEEARQELEAAQQMEMQMQTQMAPTGAIDEQTMAMFAEQYPDLYAQFEQMSPEQQQAVLARVSGQGAEMPVEEMENMDVGEF